MSHPTPGPAFLRSAQLTAPVVPLVPTPVEPPPLDEAKNRMMRTQLRKERRMRRPQVTILGTHRESGRTITIRRNVRMDPKAAGRQYVRIDGHSWWVTEAMDSKGESLGYFLSTGYRTAK